MLAVVEPSPSHAWPNTTLQVPGVKATTHRRILRGGPQKHTIRTKGFSEHLGAIKSYERLLGLFRAIRAIKSY